MYCRCRKVKLITDMTNTNDMKNILLLCIMGWACWACSEDKLELYDGTDSIYFGEDLRVGSYRDTIVFSFNDYNEDTVACLIKVRALGNLLFDYDRTYNIELTGSTATPGVHFKLPEQEYVFKSGRKDYTELPIVLYRTPDMQDTSYSITLKLVANQFFALALPLRVVDKNNNKYHDWTQQVVVFHNQMVPPTTWIRSLFGDFTVAKFILINELYGLEPADWENSTMNAGRATAIKNGFTNFLLEKLSRGWESAVKDPKGPKGYMVMPNIIIPEDFPDLTKK